ncbi:MAG: DUF1579 domain-containing protein [Phycisphaerales bacterium JB040]
MQAEPTKQHEWLNRFLGEWEFDSECGPPGGETFRMAGRETFRKLGDLWVIGEATTDDRASGPMQSIVTLGYDPMQQKYVGSWVGSPMAQLVVYSGHLDDAGNALPMDAQAPSFDDPTRLARYQDTYGFTSDNERYLRSALLGDDGNWNQFMEIVYTRLT